MGQNDTSIKIQGQILKTYPEIKNLKKAKKKKTPKTEQVPKTSFFPYSTLSDSEWPHSV